MKKGLADLCRVAEHIGETFNEALGATRARPRARARTPSNLRVAATDEFDAGGGAMEEEEL